MARTKDDKFFKKDNVSVALTDLINGTDKTQLEICEEIGLPKSNVLTMFKQGRSPLPIRHVLPLAKACGGDAKKLLMVAIEEYYPDILNALSEVKGEAMTDDEMVILKAIRKEREKTGKTLDLSPQALNKFRKSIRENLLKAS